MLTARSARVMASSRTYSLTRRPTMACMSTEAGVYASAPGSRSETARAVPRKWFRRDAFVSAVARECCPCVPDSSEYTPESRRSTRWFASVGRESCFSARRCLALGGACSLPGVHTWPFVMRPARRGAAAAAGLPERCAAAAVRSAPTVPTASVCSVSVRVSRPASRTRGSRAFMGL